MSGDSPPGLDRIGPAIEETAPPRATGVPSSAKTAAPRPRSVVDQMLSYRDAVLSNDLDAAAAALSAVGSSVVAADDIARVNEILGIGADDTDLSPGEIAEAVARMGEAEAR